MTKCKDCIELTRQLREAWERILRMDDELKQISELVRQLEQTDAPETRSI